ncbi:SGNH/GDSL hydrolase family protein [Paenibacillus oceani]|uniref:SGNH hydrolase-type esterase domain-containing protein n=1 Tax=Paenibacillus oceani TaxID=2772510 RepID=A0A927CER9_9BACL|nr:GDSL-type esterase/lipase family protein [Paenibacillus oceani]MBD2865252.1 hypothetical protein [Paenibacillus oceani]
MKLAAFGDSITAGQYVAEQETYLYKLQVRFGCETINAGVPGNTTAQGLARFERDVLAHRHDVCIVAFGMNDHVHTAPGTAKVPPEAYRDNLITIIERLKALRVIPVLCTMNPIVEGDAGRYYYRRHPQEWYTNPEGAQAWIDSYNRIVREVAASLEVPLADVAGRWERYLAQGGSLGDLLRTEENSGTDDGVHPTPAGLDLFAECIGKVLEPLHLRLGGDA